MLKLEDYRAVFVVVCLAGVMLLAAPSLSLVLHFPSGEKFSELWMLGAGHMAENYPFNITANRTYLVYVGISNHMSSSVYYLAHVKLRNQSEPLPNTTAGTPSSLLPVYTYRVFLEDGKSWEAPLTFSITEAEITGNKVSIRRMAINDAAIDLDKEALWDIDNNGYYYELFMELWTYNVGSDLLQFHNRFVGIWLNMTGNV